MNETKTDAASDKRSHPTANQEGGAAFPNLDGVATGADVSSKGSGSFKAQYINWAKTSQYLRDHAPGWMPQAVPSKAGELVHYSPNGSCYLLMRFEHQDGRVTASVPHAIMDAKMNSVAADRVSSRDISDAFVRGMCKAAALCFGLAWQMWSKDDPLERHRSLEDKPAPKMAQKKEPTPAQSLEDITRAFADLGIEGRLITAWLKDNKVNLATGITDDVIEALRNIYRTVRADPSFASVVFEAADAQPQPAATPDADLSELDGLQPDGEASDEPASEQTPNDWQVGYSKALDECDTIKDVGEAETKQKDWATENLRPDALSSIKQFAELRRTEIRNAKAAKRNAATITS